MQAVNDMVSKRKLTVYDLASLGRLRASSTASTVLEISGGLPAAVLGASWGVLGLSWALMGRSWGGHLGRPEASLGASGHVLDRGTPEKAGMLKMYVFP